MAAVVVMLNSNPEFMLIGRWNGTKSFRVDISFSEHLLG